MTEVTLVIAEQDEPLYVFLLVFFVLLPIALNER